MGQNPELHHSVFCRIALNTEMWPRKYYETIAVITNADRLQEHGLMKLAATDIASFIALHNLKEALLEPKRQSAGREGALRGAEQPQKMQTCAKIARCQGRGKLDLGKKLGAMGELHVRLPCWHEVPLQQDSGAMVLVGSLRELRAQLPISTPPSIQKHQTPTAAIGLFSDCCCAVDEALLSVGMPQCSAYLQVTLTHGIWTHWTMAA